MATRAYSYFFTIERNGCRDGGSPISGVSVGWYCFCEYRSPKIQNNELSRLWRRKVKSTMIRFLDVKGINDSYQPELNREIQMAVNSGSLIKGEALARFEQHYASFIGTRYCVGTGNGFDALRLALRAWIVMGALSEGDEVIVPANTYIASILAITENRLKPVLVEPDLRTFTVRAEAIRARITARTRAIMIVHLYGRNAMDQEVLVLAEQHKLKVLEDNAQAAGCLWDGRRTGSLGHAGAHSFFPTKNLGALGDGGAVTTDDRELADTIRTLGNYGSHHKGLNALQGVNSRLDEIQAAALNVKLPRLDADNEARRKWARQYLDEIDHPAIALPTEPPVSQEHVWHLFVLQCERRDALQQHLRSEGVETFIHYPVPPHKQQAYPEWNGHSFPVSEKIHREALSLPLSPAMNEASVTAVIEAIGKFRP